VNERGGTAVAMELRYMMGAEKFHSRPTGRLNPERKSGLVLS
jgi:hypothetical protein